MSTAGDDAADLAEQSGLVLDPWQRDMLNVGLGERSDGSLAAAIVKVIASRQNGKNGAVEAVELHDLVLAGLWIIHTSHLFTTTRESFARLLGLVEANPDVSERMTLKYASPMSGYEMRFKGGGRIKFIARSRTSGRGLTGDKLIFDEDQDLNDDAQGALLPVVSARPGAQVWYLGSAPGETSVVSQRLRSRGRRPEADDDRFAYFEFSADPEADLDDRAAWAQANPALGSRITDEAIEAERRSMSPEMFARERLSISPEIGFDDLVLPNWASCVDETAQGSAFRMVSPALAVDVSPDRQWASIAVACENPDGQIHLEVIERQRGTDGVVARVMDLRSKTEYVAVALDPAGPAGSLLADFEKNGVEILEVSARDHGQACGALFDDVATRSVRHLDDPLLNSAVSGAKRRPLGDLWAWDRKKSDVDISPLVAVTLARWAHTTVRVEEMVPLGAWR